MTSTEIETVENKSWKDVFTNGDDVVGLNLIHPEVVNLLKVKSKEELSEGERKEMIGNLNDLNLNSIMFKSSFDEMIILHHNQKVGGGLLNPKVEQFGLFGCDEIAIPFKYKPELILKINEIDSPSWETIKTVKNKEDLEAARDATPNLRQFYKCGCSPSCSYKSSGDTRSTICSRSLH